MCMIEFGCGGGTSMENKVHETEARMLKKIFFSFYGTNQVKMNPVRMERNTIHFEIGLGNNISSKKQFEMYLKKARCMKKVRLGSLSIYKREY